MPEVIKTHTGKIYVDREHQLEFLTVGDYGKENNIKADFLGLHKEIYGVQHHEVDLSDKWVATISTQKGGATQRAIQREKPFSQKDFRACGSATYACWP